MRGDGRVRRGVGGAIGLEVIRPLTSNETWCLRHHGNDMAISGHPTCFPQQYCAPCQLFLLCSSHLSSSIDTRRRCNHVHAYWDLAYYALRVNAHCTHSSSIDFRRTQGTTATHGYSMELYITTRKTPEHEAELTVSMPERQRNVSLLESRCMLCSAEGEIAFKEVLSKFMKLLEIRRSGLGRKWH